jgi:2-haloacid dehalogenase
MSRIDTVVFDLGGVLIDWNPRYLYRHIFADEAEMEHFIAEVCHHEWNRAQDGGRSFAAATEERIGVFPHYEQEIRAYFDRWEEMLGGIAEQNVKVLRRLKHQKTPLFSITNWSAETFPTALRKYDFLHFFSDVVVSGEEKLLKPDPAIYQLLLDRNQLEAERCVFIDDVAENVAGAQNLGMAGIHLLPHTDLSAELSKLGFNS